MQRYYKMGSIGCREHEEIVQTFEEKDKVGASGEEGFRTSGRSIIDTERG
jgi:hypothetical protein